MQNLWELSHSCQVSWAGLCHCLLIKIEYINEWRVMKQCMGWHILSKMWLKKSMDGLLKIQVHTAWCSGLLFESILLWNNFVRILRIHFSAKLPIPFLWWTKYHDYKIGSTQKTKGFSLSFFMKADNQQSCP